MNGALKSTLKLYLPSLILIGWAVLWAIGLRSDTLVGAALALLAVAVYGAEQERRDRYGR